MPSKLIKTICHCALITLFFLATAVSASTKPMLPIQHWTTSNGARVYFVPVKQLPMLDIKVAFSAGSARDAKTPGIAELTSNLLNQGTTSLSADQIAYQLEVVGAQYNNDTGRDAVTLSLRTLSDTELLPAALSTFQQIISQANFPQRPFLRLKQQQLAKIKQTEESPAAIAGKTFYEMVYKSHPYAHPIEGTADSIKNISRNDIQRFYRKYYVANNAVIAMVGNLDKQKAEQIAEQLTKNLKAGVAATKIPKARPVTFPTVKKISYPAVQTNIRIGQLGITRNNPDYFPLMVGNYILGGAPLISQLSEQIREKRGLSYSVYSAFIPMAAPGPFVISLGTKNEQASKAIELAKETLQNFLTNGPTEAELTAAKKNITGGFPLRLNSNKAIADNLLLIGFYNLPLDYLDTYIEKVNAVTIENIKHSFQLHINPKKLVTISVGGKSS